MSMKKNTVRRNFYRLPFLRIFLQQSAGFLGACKLPQTLTGVVGVDHQKWTEWTLWTCVVIRLQAYRMQTAVFLQGAHAAPLHPRRCHRHFCTFGLCALYSVWLTRLMCRIRGMFPPEPPRSSAHASSRLGLQSANALHAQPNSAGGKRFYFPETFTRQRNTALLPAGMLTTPGINSTVLLSVPNQYITPLKELSGINSS